MEVRVGRESAAACVNTCDSISLGIYIVVRLDAVVAKQRVRVRYWCKRRVVCTTLLGLH